MIFTDWFVPGYRAGGPIRSVLNIIEALKGEFSFSVVTRDTDFGDARPYESITSNEWNSMDGFDSFYIGRKSLTYHTIKHLLTQSVEYDVLYLNSLFSFYFTLLPLWIVKINKPDTKIILAPRGMLGKGALAIKASKKQIYLKTARLLGLYRNITWHASTELESREIHAIFGKDVRVVIAPNLVSLPDDTKIFHITKEPGTARFVFISRVSVKKNLHKALHLLKEVQANGKKKIEFDIYGPVEDKAYWLKCEGMIGSLREKDIDVTYKGVLPNGEIRTKLEEYHFFFMPTSHENFGHAIVEALAAGRPAIISDQTPWRGLETHECGWDISLRDDRKFLQVLNQCIEMDQETYIRWSERAKDFVQETVKNPDVIEQNRRLFEQV